MSKAERGVQEAEAAAESVLGPTGDDDDEQLQLILSHTSSSTTPAAVSEDELYALESTAKEARTAGSTAPQVSQNRVICCLASRVEIKCICWDYCERVSLHPDSHLLL